jgi:hypothetical protein
MEDGLREVIAFVIRRMVCQTCGAPYREEDVRPVLHEEIRHMLIATCPSCQAEQTITAYDSPPYVQLRDMARITPTRITAETVTGWATLLESFSGDMYDLLEL